MIDGKYFAIDAHCHIYPEKIVEKAVGATDAFYGVKSACYGTVEDLIYQGDKAGIDKFIVQSVATTPKQVASINEFIAREVAAHPDRLIGLGTLHPASEDIEGDVDHLISLGLRGVKLHPDIQDFKIDDYRCLKIYEQCEKKGLPILMHTGDDRYDRSNPNRLLPVMEIYTDLTVIAAHFGGYSLWESASEQLRNLPNIYVDCSSSMEYIDVDTAKRIIENYGIDRVLFATDYPMWSPEKEIQNCFALELSEEEYRKLFSLNAKKVFSIE